MLLDITKDRFEAVEVFGVPALYTTERITRSTVPRGLYVYDLQSCAEDWGRPSLIGRHITAEHFGTILAAAPIPLPGHGYRDMDKQDFVWRSSSDRPTVAEFAARHGINLTWLNAARSIPPAVR